MKFSIVMLTLCVVSNHIMAQSPKWYVCSSETGDIEAPNSGRQQTATLVLDVNKDGIDEFFVTERTAAPSVVMYLHAGGAKWERYIIDEEPLRIEASGAYYDIDADGDTDIMFAGDGRSNEIWWWENPYPNFSKSKPWQRRIIKKSSGKKHHDQVFGDFDGDGHIELAAWNQFAGHLLLFEIPDDPRRNGEWERSVIFDCTRRYEGIAAADVDLDGKLDIIGAGRWFKHEEEKSFSVHVIDDEEGREFTRSAAGQLIVGGRPEIVIVPGDASGPLRLYEWKDNDWKTHQLNDMLIHGHSLAVRDINDDGHLDIFAAEMGKPGAGENARTFIYWGNSKGEFREEIIIVGKANHESKLGDLDGDGDTDILMKPYSYQTPALHVLLQNQPKLSLEKWEKHHVDDLPEKSVFVDAADLNGDENKDIVAGAWWWQHPGKLSGDWKMHTIGSPLNNAFVLQDFDEDGDVDILGTQGFGSKLNHHFALAINEAGGKFTMSTNLATGLGGDFIQGRAVADFGRGEQVVLSWHKGGNGVHALSIPKDSLLAKWPIERLSVISQIEDLSAGDIDRDGDPDLLLGTVWLENDAGKWKGNILGVISDLDSDAGPDRNALADINQDGRLDAVIALEKGTHLIWFEAPVDANGIWERHVIAEVAGQGFSMDVADFDRDGDPDIVLGEHRGEVDNRVLIFENKDKGESWKQIVIDSDAKTNIDHHDGTQAVDMDNDGDLDIISIGWYNPKVWIFENKAIGQRK